MEYEMKPYIVYIKTDDKNRIKGVDSSAFLQNTDGWIEIDQGYTKAYHHAQGNYLPGPLMDERGILRYMAAPVAEWPEREALHRFEY